ncbi:MAG TPA: L,D-transpeptidase family protein, partial [Alphaproteobacteria bacterium]|nr:L,D-transpeptidase family protein [Alphaproteobacteria bacterium]
GAFATPAGADPIAPPVPTNDGDLIGQVERYICRHEDTLPALAVRFGVGFDELAAANPGVDAWLPGEGTELRLPTMHILPPTSRKGLVINLPEMRVFYYPADGGAVESYPIGIGRAGWQTPTGETTIVRKQANPTWYPPDSIRQEKPFLPAAVGPGPDNPLGRYALYFGWPAYLMHGTNKPQGVGRRVSHGCIRMYAPHIKRLFTTVPLGTQVAALQEPVKVGWHRQELYMEAHPMPAGNDALEAGKPLPELDWRELGDAVARARAAAGDEADRLDVALIYRTARERRGIPVRIMSRTDT